MKWMRVVIVGGMIAALAAAGFLTLRGLGVLEESDLGRPRVVPQGDQEIAYIAPSTATDGWERLVAAIKLLKKEWRLIHNTPEDLQIDDERAFLQLSADVPEVGLWFGDGDGGKLWVRWYKLSNLNDSKSWVRKLARRGTPPLAIVGGDTTDRALDMSRVLQAERERWIGAPPLFLITTATADRYLPTDAASANLSHDRWPKLLDIYPGRSFRFAFTNTRMVEAVLDFIRQQPTVWASDPHDVAPRLGIAGMDDWLSRLGSVGAMQPTQPYVAYSLAWSDDGYSKDLSEIFFRLCADRFREDYGDNGVANIIDNYVLYSAGDYFQPNRREEIAVGLFLADDRVIANPKRLLVLPTGTQRARRFLRTLCRRAPLETSKMVVATGDSISFNSVYRDRDLAWNIQDMPVPMVFFSHRNPIDRSAGFGKSERKGEPPATTGTQDLLLNRDIFEAILQAGFDKGEIVSDGDKMRDRLQQAIWHQGRVRSRLVHPAAQGALPFFDAEGNRAPGTGEHVVWLQPKRDGMRVLPEAILSVWHVDSEGSPPRWSLTDDPLHVRYDRLQDAFLEGTGP
jgi:hypothetical protein